MFRSYRKQGSFSGVRLIRAQLIDRLLAPARIATLKSFPCGMQMQTLYCSWLDGFCRNIGATGMFCTSMETPSLVSRIMLPLTLFKKISVSALQTISLLSMLAPSAPCIEIWSSEFTVRLSLTGDVILCVSAIFTSIFSTPAGKPKFGKSVVK